MLQISPKETPLLFVIWFLVCEDIVFEKDLKIDYFHFSNILLYLSTESIFLVWIQYTVLNLSGTVAPAEDWKKIMWLERAY